MVDNTTDDNSNLVDNDLDAFEEEFFQRVKSDKGKTIGDEIKAKEEENEDDELATGEGDEPDEGKSADTDPEDEDPDKDSEEADKEPAKKGKKTAQERIDEVTGKYRTTERELERERADRARERQDFERRLAELEGARRNEEEHNAPKALREQLPANAPHPDTLDKEGNRVYPLGEFDPAYIRDLTKFTIAEESKLAREAAAKAEQQQKFEVAQAELSRSWEEKVIEAEKEIPEIKESLRSLVDTFGGLDPAYGEYLAANIMACENGPQLMHYLSHNIGEAQKIVNSGPAAAALALGRLDAKFAKAPAEEKSKTKVSNAPTPPAKATRGSRGGNFSTPGDTDDLDAFEREFYKRK